MNKAVFLDRDGTVNIDKGYLYRIEEFEYRPEAVDALRTLQKWGYLLIIITNQSGIARGYYTIDDFHILNDWMIDDLQKKEIYLTDVYFCPHYPSGIVKKYAMLCNCRKPKTGLFWRACQEHDINMNKSFVIGDKIRDLSICMESGARGILLTENGRDESIDGSIWQVSSWHEALALIKEGIQG